MTEIHEKSVTEGVGTGRQSVTLFRETQGGCTGDQSGFPRATQRLPEWLKKRVDDSEPVLVLKKMLRERGLHTVCRSAGCPNLSECFQKSTATFLILGNTCTRRCGFCGVPKGVPDPPDAGEPLRVAEAVLSLGLKHAVITSVTRDDLKDGGAGQFAETVRQIRLSSPGSTIETLVPDFLGDPDSLRIVLESGVNVFNHNVETVPRLYPAVRPGADFERSLDVFRLACREYPGRLTKSGLMVGLGETRDELLDAFRRLADSGCEALTVGQYLAPSRSSVPVREYVPPGDFEAIRDAALRTGFRMVKAGPFVRSSYQADELISP
jgi:lipoic acid synthetase